MQVTELGAKFADYFEFSEPLASLPSHRILALFRGEKEEVLTLEVIPDPAAADRGEPSAFERRIASRFKIVDHGRPGDCWLIDTVRLAWRTRILGHIESDLHLRLWQAAEDAAVQVFAGNLRDLLLAAPAGAASSRSRRFPAKTCTAASSAACQSRRRRSLFDVNQDPRPLG